MDTYIHLTYALTYARARQLVRARPRTPAHARARQLTRALNTWNIFVKTFSQHSGQTRTRTQHTPRK